VSARSETRQDLVVTSFRALACELRHRFLATSGAPAIIAVDGDPGPERRHFAQRLARELRATVINADDVAPREEPVDSLDYLEELILERLSRGQSGRWHHGDSEPEESDEWIKIPPPSILVIQGSGVGQEKLLGYYSFVVWVNDVKLSSHPLRELPQGKRLVDRADLVIEGGGIPRGHTERSSFLQRAASL
jgi:hypothetical protein